MNKLGIVPRLATSSVQIRFLTVALLIAALLSAWAAIQDHFIGDLFLAKTIQSVRITSWIETMQVISFIGKTLILIAIASALFAWCLWKNQKAACLAAFGAVLSFGISPMLKSLVDRPRPTNDLIMVWRYHDSLSFPSGHVFNITILFGLLYYLAPLLVPWKGAVHLVRISSLSLIFLTGVSRVYLGAHWPSDVLGGLLYGALILTLLIAIHRFLLQRAQKRLPQAA